MAEASGGLGRSGRPTPGLAFAVVSWGSGARGMVGSLAPKEGREGVAPKGLWGNLGELPLKVLGFHLALTFSGPAFPNAFCVFRTARKVQEMGSDSGYDTVHLQNATPPEPLGPGKLQKLSSEKHLSPFLRATEQRPRERLSASRRILNSMQRDGGWSEHVLWRLSSPPDYLPHSTSCLPQRRTKKFTSSFEPICKNIAL